MIGPDYKLFDTINTYPASNSVIKAWEEIELVKLNLTKITYT